MNSNDLLRYLKNPSALSEMTLKETEQLVKEYPFFHTAWILYLRNLKNTNHPDYSGILPQAAIRSANRKWLKRFLDDRNPLPELHHKFRENFTQTPEYGVEQVDNQAEKTGKISLIDNFLAGGGKFSTLPENENAGLPVDLAEKSVEESDEIVTEIYANLLLSQANYEKALLAFEKLSLKYPEKNIYFAARIEEVKKLMNH